MGPAAFWKSALVRLVLVVGLGGLVVLIALWGVGETGARTTRMGVAFVSVAMTPFLLRGWVDARGTLRISDNAVRYRSLFTSLSMAIDDIASVSVASDVRDSEPGYVDIWLTKSPRTQFSFLSHASTSSQGIPGIVGRGIRFWLASPHEFVRRFEERGA